jgi:rhodanese-related sulfurtransferase
MKRMNLIVLSVLSLTAVFLFFLAPGTSQDKGVGEYVNVAPSKSHDWLTPPGHYGLMASYADNFLSNGPANGSYIITWAALNDAINLPDKADELSDFFIVDVRAQSAYSNGHIPGAVNILYAEVAKPWNLALLPVDQPILTVCGSGSMSGQVAAVLGMLGYEVRTLSNGMKDVPAAVLEKD